MSELILAHDIVAAIRAGDEALDCGSRGPAIGLVMLHEAEVLSAPLPADRGGRGWGTNAAGAKPMLALLTTLGGASVPLARLYEDQINAIKLVLRHGDQLQRDRVFAAVEAGTILSMWAKAARADFSDWGVDG